jgi:multidrug/hemolysin transport system permease protein
MAELALRSLKICLRDRAAVLLSFLAEIVMAGLYMLFLRDHLLAGLARVKGAEQLADVWMISGLLGVSAVTAAMSALGVMVEDRARDISRDFETSPAGSARILGGYMGAAAAAGLLMSFLMLVLSEAYLFLRFGARLGAGSMLRVYGLLLLSAGCGAAFAALPASFLKSSGALAGFCTISGALLGFLTGIYLPMGSLPEGVRTLVRCFPVSHAAALFRRTLMQPFLAESFGGSETPAALRFEEYMGVWFRRDGAAAPPRESVCFLLGSAAVCALLALLNYSVRRRG